MATAVLQELPPNVYLATPGTRQSFLRSLYKEAPTPGSRTPPRRSTFVDADKADLPFHIAQYGTASSTTWLEQRYKIWRGAESTDERPRIQGYLSSHDGHWAFAWGDPICPPTAEEMKATASEMWTWAKSKKIRLVWCCISDEFSEVLAAGIGPKDKRWGVLSCIREDVLREF